MTEQRQILLVFFSHLFLHVGSVLGSSRSHPHELWLTQKGHPGGLHPDSHPTLSQKNNKQKQNISVFCFVPAGLPGLKRAILSSSGKKKWNNTYTIKQTHLWNVLKEMHILTCMGIAPGGICAPKFIPIIPCMLGCMTGTMGKPCCCCCCCCWMGTMPAQTHMKKTLLIFQECKL